MFANKPGAIAFPTESSPTPAAGKKPRGVSSIRTRLVLSAVMMVLLPILTIGSVLVISSSSGSEQQLFSQLRTVVGYKENAISDWLRVLKAELGTVLASENTIVHLRTLSRLKAHDPNASVAGMRAGARFRSVLAQSDVFEEVFFMNMDGEVLVSTQPEHQGKNEKTQNYYLSGLEAAYTSPPVYDEKTSRFVLFASRPVRDENGYVLGVLAARARFRPLLEIMALRSGLGTTGNTYLVSQDYQVLASSKPGEQYSLLSSDPARAAIEQKTETASAYANHRGVPVLGVGRWLPEIKMAIIVEQDQAEFNRTLVALLAVSLSVGISSLIIALFGALAVTRSISTPVAQLAEVASQMAAGRLDLTPGVDSQDEIGVLAQAFASMSGQVRGFIGRLEQRVQDRTAELAQRNRYLEASAEVSRAVSSILNHEELIRTVVELVRSRFDLYYTGLFLLDDSGEWAVLKAGTGDAGAAMLARGHRLRLGGSSMIGWTIANARSRIALQAGEDPVRLATPELPETRSEAALPLRSRGQVIGAISVQSKQPNAFDSTTITLFESMADQIAVALDNASLFAEAGAALEATRKLFDEQNSQAWMEQINSRPTVGYRSSPAGLAPAGEVWNSLMEQALHAGEPVLAEGVHPGSAPGEEASQALAVPIKVRGSVIGMLDTSKPGGWSSDELDLLNTISEQLGQALDSARLYSETQLQAERERLVSEITNRMRETLDVEMILKIAAREMRQVLNLSEVEVRLSADPILPGKPVEVEAKPGTNGRQKEAGL